MNTVIVIPTYNEADNIPELTARIHASMNGVHVLLVDDSPNQQTMQVGIKHKCAVNRANYRRGLAQSVIDGIKTEKDWADRIIVMDADLQHPPEVLPAIQDKLNTSDFVIASRYTKGGSPGKWSFSRKLVSRVANLLAYPLTKFKVKDPMSGFAGFHTAGLPDLDSLNVSGYKIITELLVRGNWEHPTEIPYTFENRKHGESKLNRSHFTSYLKQLASLYLYKFRFFKFALVGISGILVNLVALFAFTELAGIPYLLSAIVASFLSITNNYTWNYLWTFKDMHTNIFTGWLKYLVMAGTASIAYIGLLAFLTEVAGIWYMASSLFAILVTFMFRYVIAKKLIWKE